MTITEQEIALRQAELRQAEAMAALATIPAAKPIRITFDASLAKEAMEQMRSFVRSELVEGIHIGKRGNASKPSLEKPGAEVILKGFQCRPEFEVTSRIIDAPKSYAYYEIICRAVHVPTGVVFSEGIGCADTTRDMGDSKQKFSWMANAALKMAKKSAMIDAAMSLGCVSELLTQDMGGELDTPAAFADYEIMERCPIHDGAEWREGKFGPYHGIKSGGFCNRRDALREVFKDACTAKGLDGKAAGLWLKDHGYIAWSKLTDAERATAIDQLQTGGEEGATDDEGEVEYETAGPVGYSGEYE